MPRPGGRPRLVTPPWRRPARSLTTAPSSPASTAWCSTLDSSRFGISMSTSEHPLMQVQADAGRQRLRDGAAGQLVAEGHRVAAHLQHAGAFGFRDRRQVRERAARSRAMSTRAGDDGELVEVRLRLPAELAHPREYRVHHGARNRRLRTRRALR